MSDDVFEVFEELFEWRKKKKRRDGGSSDERRTNAPPAAPAPVIVPIFCIACGARNEGNSKFCISCGDLLPAAGEEMRCPRCSSVLPLAAKFCPRCGASLN